jgi:FkbM family methyltransferase
MSDSKNQAFSSGNNLVSVSLQKGIIYANYINSSFDYLKQHRTFKKAPLKTLFRSIHWLFHCLLGIPATINLNKWNCKFFLPPKLRNAGSTGFFVIREDYEPELNYLESVLSPGKVFVDGGANFGIYTVLASQLVGDSGRVLSFEPAAESFPILKHNVELNKMSNVKLFNLAISDKEENTRFYHIDNAPNSYSLGSDVNSETNFEEVQTTTLDKVLSDEGIERVDLIKLDVEGAEELVLQGARSLFSRMRPTLILEINPTAIARLGLSPDGIVNLLKEWDYDLFGITNAGELFSLSLDASFHGNVIAIPRNK